MDGLGRAMLGAGPVGRPDSDVDLLADLPPGLNLFGLGRAEADLEVIIGTVWS
jgi:predicted nucleotidyltransferase